MNQETYDKLLYQAKICIEAGRSEETLEYMENIIKNKKDDLTEEERNLVTVASKNLISTKRSAWRSIYGLEVREKGSNSKYQHLVSDLKLKLEKELKQGCNRMLNLIDTYLMKRANTAVSKVFYLKCKGDHYRYIAEFTLEDNHEEVAKSSLNSYQQASEAAKALPNSNPIKLGLALNYSVFYYEVMNNPLEAINIANKAFNEGISNLDNMDETEYKDSTNILQLLKENITMWSSDLQEEQNEDLNQ